MQHRQHLEGPNQFSLLVRVTSLRLPERALTKSLKLNQFFNSDALPVKLTHSSVFLPPNPDNRMSATMGEPTRSFVDFRSFKAVLEVFKLPPVK